MLEFKERSSSIIDRDIVAMTYSNQLLIIDCLSDMPVVAPTIDPTRQASDDAGGIDRYSTKQRRTLARPRGTAWAGLLLLCLLLTGLPSVWAKDGPEKSSYWWQFLTEIVDLSTEPAEDFIPYNWLKDKAHQYGVAPAQNRFDGPVESADTTPWRYDPKPEAVQRAQRDRNLQEHRQSMQQNRPATPAELEALPESHYPRERGDVAPPGDWRPLAPVKPLSFGQWSTSLIKKHLDPSDQAGYLKLLDTAQTFQHLIDCRQDGKSARDCLTSYGLNFASSKAVIEFFTALGRWGGKKYLSGYAYSLGATPSELGGRLAAGSGIVLYLAYADYMAIQDIMECTSEAQGWWNAYQQSLLSQIEAEANDEANWDGTLNQLEQRLAQFRDRFDQGMEEAGQALLDTWDRSGRCAKEVGSFNDAVEKAIRELMTVEEFRRQMKAACEGTGDRSNAVKGIEEDLRELAAALGEAEKGARECDTNIKKLLLGDRYREARAIADRIGLGIRDGRKADGQSFENREERIARARAQLLEEVGLAQAVETAYRRFEEAYNRCVADTFQAAKAWERYRSLHRAFEGRLRNLALFYDQRGAEMLSEEDLQEARRQIAALGDHVASFKPQKRHFDDPAAHWREIADNARDLRFMEGLGGRIKQTIAGRLAELEKVTVACGPMQIVIRWGDLERQLSNLETRLNRLPGLIEQCTNREGERLARCKVLAMDYEICHFTLAREADGLSADGRRRLLEKSNKVQAEIRALNCSEKDLIREDLLLAQEECRQLSGGVVREDSASGQFGCLCPGGTVKGYGSFGLSCMPCAQMESNFNQAVASGDDDRARKLLEKSRDCPWAQAAQTQLQAQDQCQNQVQGSQPVLQNDGTISCQCLEGTVLTRYPSGAYVCVPCPEMRSNYDQAVAGGEMDRASTIMQMSLNCPWTQAAQNQLQAQTECEKRVPGSQATFLADGHYRCDCPGSVTVPAAGDAWRCSNCPELLEMVNRAGYAGDVASLQQLVPLAQNCPWYQNAAQQVSQMAQNQYQGQQACADLNRQIQMACSGGQWITLPALYAQTALIPGCVIDPALVAACNTAQSNQFAQQLQQFGQHPPRSYPPPRPAPGDTRPPVKSGPGPGPGSVSAPEGKQFWAVRYIREGTIQKGTHSHREHSVWVECTYWHASEVQAELQKIRMQMAPKVSGITHSVELLGGPYPNRQACESQYR